MNTSPKDFFIPVSGFDLPRFAGIATFMRLPLVTAGHDRFDEVDIGLVGIPWDGGTTNRPGARHGPRQMRDQSTMIRSAHPVWRTSPFETCNCADLGDVGPNPADVMDTVKRITDFYEILGKADIRPLSAGGDHLSSLPVLRGLTKGAAFGEPLAMVHFDSHTDLFAGYFGGSQYTHGTPFRQAIEEGLLNPEKVIQIGIRGTMYDGDDIEWGRSKGVTIITIEEMFDRGPQAIMEQAHKIIGNSQTYVSFDIDFIDPAFAPGTGTPEIGGPDTFTAQQMVRMLHGANIVGADVVEVSPPFDQSGMTAYVGASIMFELLCIMAEQKKGADKRTQ